MTIKRRSKSSGKREIDLAGPDGNAFVLMGFALNFSRQLKLDGKAITEEMRSGDYQNLVKVFEKHFGSFVDIILPAGVKSIDELQ